MNVFANRRKSVTVNGHEYIASGRYFRNVTRADALSLRDCGLGFVIQWSSS
jgi:hypothetical protein